jgi:phenylalanyl-tRNA synthetase alpha chain
VSESPLHPIERAMLLSLSKTQDEKVEMTSLAKASGLSLDQIRRGIEWLRTKGLVNVEEKEAIRYVLGEEGKKIAAEGLPERKLVIMLQNSRGSANLSEISKSMGSELQVALGKAKKNGWIKLEGERISLARKHAEEPEESVLRKMKSTGSVLQSELTPQELETITELRKRRDDLIRVEREKKVELSLSNLGKQAALTVNENEIDEITPSLLQSGEWRQRPLRALDVTSPAPNIFAGRRHPMRMFMDEVREAFVSLGFEEIKGSMVQSSLWNFDALFIPQQHSAREMQDTFYLHNLKAKLDSFRKEIEAIKKAHESGGNTGSLGWQYDWKEEEASRVVLRTHTTAVTISYLVQFKPEDARVFSVGRVFRNEKSNYKHNPEFWQIEGVMVGEKLNLRNLIFMISKFYAKLGFKEIKFWPTYFPYTEPSLQTMVYLKESDRWMELGGMGPFRPEVTLPLGIRNPVLAWGLSLDRLVMLRHKVSDIRELFGANLGWLRNEKVL